MPDDEYGPEAEGLGFQPSLPRPNTQFLPSLLHLIVLFFLFPIVRLFSSKMSKDLRPSKFSKEFSNFNMFSIQNKDYIRYQNILRDIPEKYLLFPLQKNVGAIGLITNEEEWGYESNENKNNTHLFPSS